MTDEITMKRIIELNLFENHFILWVKFLFFLLKSFPFHVSICDKKANDDWIEWFRAFSIRKCQYWSLRCEIKIKKEQTKKWKRMKVKWSRWYRRFEKCVRFYLLGYGESVSSPCVFFVNSKYVQLTNDIFVLFRLKFIERENIKNLLASAGLRPIRWENHFHSPQIAVKMMSLNVLHSLQDDINFWRQKTTDNHFTLAINTQPLFDSFFTFGQNWFTDSYKNSYEREKSKLK